jgi:hypothetical protein
MRSKEKSSLTSTSSSGTSRRNRTHLKSAAEKIGKQLDEDNSEQVDRKANLDEANVYLTKLREVKRQLKKEKREADQRAALERAKAAVGDGRREPKPKREIGSAAAVFEPKPEPPVYKPPSAQTGDESDRSCTDASEENVWPR